LVAVNAIIAAHVVLYYVYDQRGIGCVDFFGLASFLGQGKITAGSLFILALLLVTLLFGRVFCGWGCHFALFQDLLVKFFGKIGLRTPFRRSRLELVVPPLMLVVTLSYPIIVWWRSNGMPTTTSTDLSFPPVWHLLPGAKGVALILGVDVILLTALFGSRAFCRYVCPYGLLLKFFHALAPLRVVKVGDCSDCGACARVCPTGVPIKYEAERFGVVRDLNCMNCGDCVAACPSGALALRPTTKGYLRGWVAGIGAVGQPVWVEATILAGVMGALATLRGREYGDFLVAGMGLVTGSAVVGAIRPNRILPRRLLTTRTKARYQVALAGVASFLVAGMVGQALSLSALARGERALADTHYDAMLDAYSDGNRAAAAFRPFTFYLDDFRSRSPRHVQRLLALGDQLMRDGEWVSAELTYRSVLALDNDQPQAYGNLGTALFKQRRFWEAALNYLRVLEYDPHDLVVLYHLALTRIELRQLDDASQIVQLILSIDTVGNAYDLIKTNPIFERLNKYEGYRRAMALYERRGLAPQNGKVAR
jgi:polyferredoxin/Tfp pilus assembly protein PilF